VQQRACGGGANGQVSLDYPTLSSKTVDWLNVRGRRYLTPACQRRLFLSKEIFVSISTASSRCVGYCMGRIQLLVACGVTPIVVFDGARLPIKAGEEGSRQRSVTLNAPVCLQRNSCLSFAPHFALPSRGPLMPLRATPEGRGRRTARKQRHTCVQATPQQRTSASREPWTSPQPSPRHSSMH
jgi:XPG N-terminal domain